MEDSVRFKCNRRGKHPLPRSFHSRFFLHPFIYFTIATVVIINCAVFYASLTILDNSMGSKRHLGSTSENALHPSFTLATLNHPSSLQNQHSFESRYAPPSLKSAESISLKSPGLQETNVRKDSAVVAADVLPGRSDEEWSNGGKEKGLYIVIRVGKSGQGAGNYAHGLLAGHLFGLEFNRTVCVVWDKFFEGFDYANSEHEQACKGAESWKSHGDLFLWNYLSQAPDECALRETLASPAKKVVSYSGNTYPGWRTDIPPNFFYRYYKPKPELLHVLPYPPNKSPKVVVHLRSPDGTSDAERGLDEESLHALGELLIGDGTYLVTNRPDWYRRFHDCCGWSYDVTWEGKPIEHGALILIWDADGKKVVGREAAELKKKISAESRRNSTLFNNGMAVAQNIKLWSDWYTMLNAERVYHSSSDFSRSAVHWNAHGTGYQLNGMHNKNFKRELNLVPAPYDAIATKIPALVDRLDPGPIIHRDDDCKYLRFCQSRLHGSNRNGKNSLNFGHSTIHIRVK